MKKLFALLAVAVLISATAQKQKSEASAQPKFNSDLYKGMKWRNIGPYRGGRANAIAGIPNNDQTYFTGYTGGGIWKTEDAGKNWKNVSDGFFKVGSMGDIAVSESDPT